MREGTNTGSVIAVFRRDWLGCPYFESEILLFWKANVPSSNLNE